MEFSGGVFSPDALATEWEEYSMNHDERVRCKVQPVLVYKKLQIMKQESHATQLIDMLRQGHRAREEIKNHRRQSKTVR